MSGETYTGSRAPEIAASVFDCLNRVASGGTFAAPDEELLCPMCGEPVWDLPHGSKLAKCWNSGEHEHGGPLAFDTMTDD